MTLTSAVINDAFRENNIIPIGAEPTDLQYDEALRELRRIIAGVLGLSIGDRYFDWPVGNLNVTADTDWNQTLWSKVLANARLIVNSDTAQTVSLPPDPQDGARIAVIDPENRLSSAPLTLKGNGREVVSGPELLLNVNGTSLQLFYRADLGRWVEILPLTGVDPEEFPFPEEFDHYFINRLNMRLSSRYGRAPTEESTATMLIAERNLRSRYYQTQIIPPDIGVLLLSRQAYTARITPHIVRGRVGWE
jgi:hypothetical protein